MYRQLLVESSERIRYGIGQYGLVELVQAYVTSHELHLF